MNNWTSELVEENGTIRNYTIVEIEDNALEFNYIIVPGVLICLCTIAVVINVRILVSTRWIRRPLSPTLFMSLSLALADAVTAGLLGTGLILNSLLPYGFRIAIEMDPCFTLTLEAIRLACILITMIHLLALAGNHYFGILCPFKSRRWLTHNNITVLVIIIWILPILYMFTYFSSFEGHGFRAGCNSNETLRFITRQKFRTMYSTLIFVPLVIMFIIYCHISVIVRKHQASRRWFNRHSRHGRGRETRSEHNQQFDRNLKAIWTTLLILLSYLICFMPAVVSFGLICADCFINFESIESSHRFIINSASNFLLIIKPLLNPLIYASRMHEIRAATRRMNDSCRRIFYPFVSQTELDQNQTIYGSTGDGLPQRFSFVSGSTRRNHYSLTSAQHIGNGYTKRSIRRRGDDMATDL